MNLMHLVQTWTVDTLLPRRCVVCSAPDAVLCPPCTETIVTVKQQCWRCFRISAEGKTCSRCRRHSALDRLLVAAHYHDGALKELIHTYKYHGRLDALPILTEIVTSNRALNTTLSHLPRGAVIVPVPLHRRRLFARGFNQSHLLGQQLSHFFSIPINQRLLWRTISTPPQALLAKTERQENVAKAFRAHPSNHKTVVLVDDIATTGATLNACASALKAVGVTRVIGVVVARSL